MEPVACADMLTLLHDCYCVDLELICMDDDSSTRQAIRWNNANYLANNNTDKLPQVLIAVGKNKGKLQNRPDKGQLPGHIPESKCTLDPNHRRKQLTGELLELSMKKVKERLTMTKMDVKRIGKNFGYMARSLPKMREDQYCQAAKAVLEHHFDNHQYCADWCRRKLLTPEAAAASQRYYRCKTKDGDLYQALASIVDKYITFNRLKEIAHGMDTNANESINNIISYFAPKNRVYCATRLLQTRIGIAIGIISLGFRPYFQRLFKELGIAMPSSVLHYLEVRDNHRIKCLLKATKASTKKIRMQRKFELLKKDEEDAKQQRDKRDGTYKSGGHMAIEGGFDGIEQETSSKPSSTAKKRVCPFCGLAGHVTTRSKKCKKHPANVATSTAPVPAAAPASPIITKSAPIQQKMVGLDPSDDIDAHDALPFDTELPGMDCEAEDEFHDCGTWSKDVDSFFITNACL